MSRTIINIEQCFPLLTRKLFVNGSNPFHKYLTRHSCFLIPSIFNWQICYALETPWVKLSTSHTIPQFFLCFSILYLRYLEECQILQQHRFFPLISHRNTLNDFIFCLTKLRFFFGSVSPYLCDH